MWPSSADLLAELRTNDRDPILRMADPLLSAEMPFDPARESESRTDYDDGSNEGEQVGHAILLRRKKRTLFVLFAGFFFEGRRAFLALIEPKLNALNTSTAS